MVDADPPIDETLSSFVEVKVAVIKLKGGSLLGSIISVQRG